MNLKAPLRMYSLIFPDEEDAKNFFQVLDYVFRKQRIRNVIVTHVRPDFWTRSELARYARRWGGHLV